MSESKMDTLADDPGAPGSGDYDARRRTAQDFIFKGKLGEGAYSEVSMCLFQKYKRINSSQRSSRFLFKKMLSFLMCSICTFILKFFVSFCFGLCS